MAEATLTAETEVTPTEDEAVVSPEAPEVSTPAPENVEVVPSFADEIFDRIASAGTENAGADSTNAASDKKVPPAEPTLSPEQIRADERNRVNNENRFKGLKTLAMESGPAALAKFADRLDTEEQREFHYILNQIKGAVQPLADRAVDVDTNFAPAVHKAGHTDGWNAAITGATEQSWEVLDKRLGVETRKAIQAAAPASWGEFQDAIITAATKGTISVAAAKAALDNEFAKVEQALKERGAAGVVTRSLDELRGSTGPDTPAARGGSTNLPTMAQYTAATFSQRMAWQKANPNIETEIIEREAARRV